MSRPPRSVIRHGVSRREFATLGSLSVALLPVHALASGEPETAELGATLLMDLELDVGVAQSLGPRQIYPVTGGTFDGPRLRGVALNGGGDWVIRRPDGANELNVRVTLQTDDDELIYLWYRGIIFTPEGGETYWRTTPVFETASEKYGWLNRIISVGVGRPSPGKAAYRVFQIL